MVLLGWVVFVREFIIFCTLTFDSLVFCGGKDVSEFVHEQGRIAKQARGSLEELVCARERVFTPISDVARSALNLAAAPDDLSDSEE
jgi:hypothetical protein